MAKWEGRLARTGGRLKGDIPDAQALRKFQGWTRLRRCCLPSPLPNTRRAFTLSVAEGALDRAEIRMYIPNMEYGVPR